VSGLHGVPPGRAGRVWLLHRLRTAERGVELMHGKLRVLEVEQRRYRERSDRSAAEWERACRDAEAWFLRAALLSGRQSIDTAAPAEPAEVDVGWTVAMGVRHPDGATVRPAQPPLTAAPPDNSALILAGAAYRTALPAAARSAVDTAALLRLDTEVTTTRRRLRAVEDRWIPRLAGALRRIEQGLEETELADSSRLRWATTGGRGRPPARR